MIEVFQLQNHICAGPEEEELVSEMRHRNTEEELRGGRTLAQLVEMPHDMAAAGTMRMCWQGCQGYRDIETWSAPGECSDD